MSLTTSEVESLRFHLGYGNIGAAGAPYTPDTFLEIFESVISPNLTTGNETSATATIEANSLTVVTPAAMTGIAVYGSLVVDVGEDAEVVMVKAATGSTFTARFAKAHSTGYPIATMSGLARLRLLLWDADQSWKDISAKGITSRAGLKRVDEVELFEGGKYLSERIEHYLSVVNSISSLVQVSPKFSENKTACGRLEAY